ncbi:MAG: hypothetical protein AAF437_15450 [Pseudomonadota bacterium]
MLSQFKTEQSGQVAVIFAFSLLPICAVGGFCLDTQHKMQRIMKVQSVMDAAILAAGRVKQSGATELEIESALVDFVTPQLAGLPGLNCAPPTLTILVADDQLLGSIDCRQETTLMQIFGHTHMPFTSQAASHYAVGRLDAAFVFDASNSMSGQRMTELKEAATEAINTLLPADAPADVISNTRIAMASYSTMLNAGPYFQQVTNVPPTRTYYHTVERDMTDADRSPGSLFDEIFIGLYDADGSNLISELGNNAVIKVTHAQLADMTITVTLTPSHSLYTEVESVRLELSGEESADKTENVSPYSLYGDSGLANLDGEHWQPGDYSIRIRAYRRDNLIGLRVFDEEIDFELFVDGQKETSTATHTITSTCVWDRDGDEKFTDAAPGPGAYLSHLQAWFKEIGSHPDGGYWETGFNQYGERRRSAGTCITQPPVELTNERDDLIDYVSTLTMDSYTAGHLGVAWAYYLISDRWASIFDDTAEPTLFTDTDTTKAVILMTDGAFNYYGHRGQGDSDQQARALCDEMKGKEIAIYSVAFRAPSAGKQLMEYCATTPAFYFDARNGTELKRAYKEIALYLSDLRLSQ